MVVDLLSYRVDYNVCTDVIKTEVIVRGVVVMLLERDYLGS